jgi:hypothetical protein
MLGQPALVAGHRRRDAQREAFLAEQRITAIARSVAPDLSRFREVHDVFVVAVARPGKIRLPGLERMADRVEAGNERPLVAENLEDPRTHARHDPHIRDDVGAVRNLHADMRDWRSDRSHAEGNHVHRAAPHRSAEEARERLAHLLGRLPVVGRAGVGFVLGADECAVFYPRHIGGIRANQVAIRSLRVVQPNRGPGREHELEHPVVLGLGSVAPLDPVGLGQLRDLVDPGEKASISGRGRFGHSGLLAGSGRLSPTCRDRFTGREAYWTRGGRAINSLDPRPRIPRTNTKAYGEFAIAGRR